jgi:universal stress protein A
MQIKKVLVTLDGSELAEAALKYAAAIAEPGARIHLLTVATEYVSQSVLTPDGLIRTPSLMRDVNWPPLDGVVDTELVYAHERYMQRVSDWLTEAGFTVSSEVRFGPIVDTIVEVAEADFDAVVMASHGRTGLRRLALGSIAEGVLHKSPCPVLIIPARALERKEA